MKSAFLIASGLLSLAAATVFPTNITLAAFVEDYSIDGIALPWTNNEGDVYIVDKNNVHQQVPPDSLLYTTFMEDMSPLFENGCHLETSDSGGFIYSIGLM
ncbi:LAQU0S06e01750g1_1 [Lachancea quebecensis]|uniref:LAQU0S06e01750g1_1 n=1 Tax=Lachancea quebecensis TaxID=1654605 RepID=A0A0P1KS28_9SACH|nr:LAQU0S06e01750g1_1 [Lachancea quebecensis]